MLHLLNKNLNLQLVILILLIGWSAWNIFAHMTLMPAEGSMLLYHPIAKLWTWSPVLVRILAFLIVLTMTYGVMQLFQQKHFYDNRTYMPGIFLLLTLNSGKFLNTFSPALLTTFFIALIMLLYLPSESASKAKDRIFTFGLAIAIATPPLKTLSSSSSDCCFPTCTPFHLPFFSIRCPHFCSLGATSLSSFLQKKSPTFALWITSHSFTSALWSYISLFEIKNY